MASRAAAILLCAVCVAASAITLSDLSSASPRPDHSNASPHTVVAFRPQRSHRLPLSEIRKLLPAQRTAFRVLDGAAAADVSLSNLKPSFVQTLTNLGANLALARAVASPAGTEWIIPANGYICVHNEATNPAFDGGFCVSDSAAAEGYGMSYSTAASAPGETFISGLADNGISSVTVSYANGTTATIPVANNAYAAVLTAKPVSITRTTASGVTQKTPIVP